jgi:hypothetical protein
MNNSPISQQALGFWTCVDWDFFAHLSEACNPFLTSCISTAPMRKMSDRNSGTEPRDTNNRIPRVRETRYHSFRLKTEENKSFPDSYIAQLESKALNFNKMKP